MNNEEKALYQKIIDKWGKEAQLEMVIEECAELIDAIQKLKRERFTSLLVISEACDVEVMLKQLEVLLDSPHLWDNCRKDRMNHLKKLIGET